MSTPNQFNADIPQEVIDSVTEKLKQCQEALTPYLLGLTAKERQTLFKMGNKTVATVQKVDSYLKSNPEFAPAYMDQQEFQKDIKAVNQLEEISNLSLQLSTDINDTRMLAGSEALMASMLYYGQIKEAYSKGIAKARPIYEDLQERFSKKKRKSLGNQE